MKTNWHTGLIAAVSAVAFGGLIVGCSKQNQNVEEVDVGEVGGGSGQPLVLYTWGDYFPEEVLSQFNEEMGIEVVLDTFDTLDEMMAKLRSEPGSVDVLIVDDSTISDIAALGLLEKLDHQLLSDLGNIDATYMELPFDPKNQHSVPYLWGSTLVAYRADRITDPQKSWAELWNPAYKGHVMMLDEPEDLFVSTLLERGFDRNSKAEAELDACKDRLIEQITEVGVRYGTYSDVKDGLASGNVWIAQCYSGDAALLGLEDENIRYFIPDEGAPLWIDNFVIAKDSEKLGAAHQFINFCLQADVAAQCADFAWYATPNALAKPMLDAELLADDALSPSAEVMALCAFSDMNVQVERERVLNNAMNELYAVLRKQEVLPDEGSAVADEAEGSEAQAAAALD